VTKGQATRDAIVREALAHATRVGLEGLSLGTLADSLGPSKSGLFAGTAACSCSCRSSTTTGPA
jgi:hypothetical protein